MSRYFMLAAFVVAILSYSSRMEGPYQSTTIGATVGGAAGVILSSGTPLGLIGGLIVGGLVGNKMEGDTAATSGVATLRQDKQLNVNS
jgi:osmotically inducible lipoprotein OsmB